MSLSLPATDAAVVPGNQALSPPASGKLRAVLAIAFVALGAVLLLARLGTYALWDDESLTALAAKGVWATGDTSVLIGHNVVAYRGGALLRNWHERSTPPLPAYLAAPFTGLLGDSAGVARLPFALLGILCLITIARWLWTDHADLRTWLLVSLGVLCNVSFLLYFRNCRYYSPAIFTSVLIAYLYLHWNGRRSTLLAMAFLSLCLLASQYLNYACLYACLAVDDLFWGRHRRKLTAADWGLLLVPQVLLGAAIVMVWNTLGTRNGQSFFASALLDKSQVFWRICRDVNECEYWVSSLILLAPLMYLRCRDPWLLRAPLALLTYLIAMSLLSPTLVSSYTAADVRYLAPIIPLAIAIAVLTLRAIGKQAGLIVFPLALVAFGSDLLNWCPFQHGGWRSGIAQYVRELISPPGDPYTLAADWINRHVADGQTILVRPDYMTYPLMYHAPRAVYAWQFPPTAQSRLTGLAPIHFQGLQAPDYLIAFGHRREELARLAPVAREKGLQCRLVQTFNFFGHDAYRPELMYRVFEPKKDYDKQEDAIYIYQLSSF